MNPMKTLRRFFDNSARSAQLLAEIREGVANSPNRTAQLLAEIREGIANGADHSGSKLDMIGRELANLANTFDTGTRENSAPSESIQVLQEIRANLSGLTGAVVQSAKEAHSVGLEIHRELVALRKAAGERGYSAASASGPTGATSRGRRRKTTQTNDIAAYIDAFEGLTPYAGAPPPGFLADWSGVLTDTTFQAWMGPNHSLAAGAPVQTVLPTVAQGEGWFESVNWVEAAREASGQFVMITLGACYGAQAVGSWRALQLLNPLPCKLVAVEPEPENLQWIKRHFFNNGIEPNDHWILGAAISDTRAPVFFPVGAPGTGAQNCYSTNERAAREAYVAALTASDARDEALRNLLVYNSTGITKNLTGDGDERFDAKIKLVSAVTLEDVLGPFDFVDYLEADIQQSEILVFPPFLGLLKKKVRRIHLGTHGKDVHEELAGMFRHWEWDVIFDYAPNGHFETPFGDFSTNDGVLTVRNPHL